MVIIGTNGYFRIHVCIILSHDTLGALWVQHNGFKIKKCQLWVQTWCLLIFSDIVHLALDPLFNIYVLIKLY